MNLSLGDSTSTDRNAKLVGKIEQLTGVEPRTLRQITGTGLIISKQHGAEVGAFWYLVITDIMSDNDRLELEDLSAELGAPWQSRVLEAEYSARPNPQLPGSTQSFLYTVHAEARS
ncbi:hypothetical protein [Streptomyces noursei]|uniref:hypothetical protein n=1 Tax=Streptomyces noursei TaxID=1971 RepID=UPI001673171C|nr:hypothetical protein [Streptomyces noursei]MCZ1015598.1 hypothetical protein [Streptomyces noursei]GGW89376.1 hypothetical protein GCM10010341_07710 [Streptomyces noursei]